jgi:hypothetical protein
MSDLPFAITPEAVGHIERVLVDAQKNLTLLAMARVLVYSSSVSWTNDEGSGGWYPFPHVIVCWHPVAEVVGNSEYTKLPLAGFQVYAHRDTLERLRGKRIVLDKGQGMAGRDILAVEGDMGEQARPAVVKGGRSRRSRRSTKRHSSLMGRRSPLSLFVRRDK